MGRTGNILIRQEKTMKKLRLSVYVYPYMLATLKYMFR